MPLAVGPVFVPRADMDRDPFRSVSMQPLRADHNMAGVPRIVAESNVAQPVERSKKTRGRSPRSGASPSSGADGTAVRRMKKPRRVLSHCVRVMLTVLDPI